MFSENIVAPISEELDKIFDNDKNILTLACIRIDGPVFYIRNRNTLKGRSSSYEARLSSTILLIKNLGAYLMQMNGDSNTRFISFSNLEKKICVCILDFFLIYVDTNSKGNAKGIAKSIASLF